MRRIQKDLPQPNPGHLKVMESLFGGTSKKKLPKMYRTSQAKKSRNTWSFSNFYLPVLIPAVLLIIYGLVVIWSASLTIPRASLIRQLVGVVLGVILAGFIWKFDYRKLSAFTKLLLILDIALMISPRIPGLGVFAMGMDGWVKIPLIGIRFQPSEPAKLVTIFLMASLASQYNGKIDSLKEYVKLCVILCVPFFAILVQPDLGTGLIVLVSGAAIIIVAGAKKSWVLVTIALIVLSATLIIYSSMTPGLPHILKPYQLKRLTVFIDPTVDPSGDGYNLQQAQIAVGSGGLLGKGIGHATQAGQGFLPEAHTDFVFALLSEEFGFVGSSILLLLFGWLLFATITLAVRISSPFAKLILVGIVAMWSFQILENIGMCIGVMPITGIPLPFISFGSSSMVSQIAAVGVVQSIWNYRTKV